MTDALRALAGRDDEAPIEHAAPEAVLVEAATEDRLVDEAQVAQTEVRWQQLEADRRVVELAADAFDRHAQDLGVVEGEGQGSAGLVEGLDGSAALAGPGDVEAGESHVGIGRAVPERAGLDEGVVRN
jgi:hypothetical protein